MADWLASFLTSGAPAMMGSPQALPPAKCTLAGAKRRQPWRSECRVSSEQRTRRHRTLHNARTGAPRNEAKPKPRAYLSERHAGTDARRGHVVNSRPCGQASERWSWFDPLGSPGARSLAIQHCPGTLVCGLGDATVTKRQSDDGRSPCGLPGDFEPGVSWARRLDAFEMAVELTTIDPSVLSFPKIISARINNAVRQNGNGNNGARPLDRSMQGRILL